jgi:hypothetical protein
VEFIYQTQDRDKWEGRVETELNLQAPKNVDYFFFDC